MNAKRSTKVEELETRFRPTEQEKNIAQDGLASAIRKGNNGAELM